MTLLSSGPENRTSRIDAWGANGGGNAGGHVTVARKEIVMALNDDDMTTSGSGGAEGPADSGAGGGVPGQHDGGADGGAGSGAR